MADAMDAQGIANRIALLWNRQPDMSGNQINRLHGDNRRLVEELARDLAAEIAKERERADIAEKRLTDLRERYDRRCQQYEALAPSSRYDIVEEAPCPACSGSGYRTYATTGTWRSGAGGMTMTDGVCDKCWGSGHRDKPWPSHSLLSK